MKRILSIALMLIALSMSNVVLAGQKQDMRVAYVLRNLGVKRDVQAKLKPLLEAYLRDKKDANKEYDNLKAKYKVAIKNGTLTDSQAESLIGLKWTAANKELGVKKAYTNKFRAVLPYKKVWYCFDLLNDKNSKVLGRQTDDDED